MYSGGSGLSIDIHVVDIELSYDVLSPLPIVLSKHFNHPHPYIEIATAISDMDHSYSTLHATLNILFDIYPITFTNFIIIRNLHVYMSSTHEHHIQTCSM